MKSSEEMVPGHVDEAAEQVARTVADFVREQSTSVKDVGAISIFPGLLAAEDCRYYFGQTPNGGCTVSLSRPDPMAGLHPIRNAAQAPCLSTKERTRKESDNEK